MIECLTEKPGAVPIALIRGRSGDRMSEKPGAIPIALIWGRSGDRMPD